MLGIDVMYLLVGRHRARTKLEWNVLAKKAGFLVEKVSETSSPSCHILILTKRKENS